MTTTEVAIVGAGPAGLATGLQLKRQGVDALIFERDRIGGLLRNANWVENYLGFPDGIAGPALIALMRAQVEATQVTILLEEVRHVKWAGSEFHLHTQSSQCRASILVVASGTQPIRFTDFEIPESLSHKVTYEVFSLQDAAQCRIVIVGAGDAAFDYALNLSRNNDIVILNRGTHTRCLPLLWDRTKKVPNISYKTRTRIRCLAESRHGGLQIACITPDGDWTLAADYLIGAIGREPCLDFLAPELWGQRKSLEDRGVLYLIGDVGNQIYRQTAIASGEGIITAMKIHSHLQEKINEGRRHHRER